MTLLHMENVSWLKVKSKFNWLLAQLLILSLVLSLRFYYFKKKVSNMDDYLILTPSTQTSSI
jgi:hypothetical protein